MVQRYVLSRMKRLIHFFLEADPYEGRVYSQVGNEHFVNFKYGASLCLSHDKWVPVTTAWLVLRLLIKERPPIYRVAANILDIRRQSIKKPNF